MNKHQKVAVSAFIHRDGKVLVVKRSDNDTFLPSYWELVGGKIEWGENPHDGLVREVREEAGIDVITRWPYHVWDYVTEADQRHLVEVVFVCDMTAAPKVTLSAEHQEFRWVSENDLPALNPMTDAMRAVIAKGFRECSVKIRTNTRC